MKKEQPQTQAQTASYPLRLDGEVRAKLEALAKANGRSLNTQISMMLEAALEGMEISTDHQPPNLENLIRTIALDTAKQAIQEAFAKAGIQLSD